ncbi:MAG: hypothetical protein K6C98_09760, partial [Treponema sp.]|nr:hypothetical protein [Treponema sp.]
QINHTLNPFSTNLIRRDFNVPRQKFFPAVKAVINSFFCLYGARSTCLLFSLIECAKINNINPEEYLSSIFELAADTTDWTDSNFRTSSLEH